MFDVKFDFDAKGFERQVLKAARDSVEERVRRIRCPAHHQAGRVRFTGHGDRLSWAVEGCCQRLVDAVQKALN